MNQSIVFTSAKYVNSKQDVIEVVVDGVTMHVPNNAPANRHYAEILRQVEAGKLTIADAD